MGYCGLVSGLDASGRSATRRDAAVRPRSNLHVPGPSDMIIRPAERRGLLQRQERRTPGRDPVRSDHRIRPRATRRARDSESRPVPVRLPRAAGARGGSLTVL